VTGLTEEMSGTIQILLLNFGVLSHREASGEDWQIRLTSEEVARFRAAVLEQKAWFGTENHEDEIIAIESGRADVFDVSVEETHRYVAGGLVNHNSYWHSTIMTQKALSPSEMIDYADHHSGTMATSRTRLNPYKLGIELLRDIEFRWNTGRFGKEYEECDDLDKKRTWDKQLGLGRQKIFEVRRIHNDITFIDNFLTPEFCVQHNMFSFAYQEQGGQYVIESRDFEKIKQRLLFSLTNFGKPWIYVLDGNYRNRGELLLKHQHTGVELKLDQAADTLANIQYIWGRPVHLQTLVDGKPTQLSFDGTDHSIRTGGDNDDARRNPPAKTR
jgi:stage V sporulation protein R